MFRNLLLALLVARVILALPAQQETQAPQGQTCQALAVTTQVVMLAVTTQVAQGIIQVDIIHLVIATRQVIIRRLIVNTIYITMAAIASLIIQGITILAINIQILETPIQEARSAIQETHSTIHTQETHSTTLRMQGGREIQGMLGQLVPQEAPGTPGHLETSEV